MLKLHDFSTFNFTHRFRTVHFHDLCISHDLYDFHYFRHLYLERNSNRNQSLPLAQPRNSDTSTVLRTVFNSNRARSYAPYFTKAYKVSAMRSLRGAVRQKFQGTGTLVSSAGHGLIVTATSTSYSNNIFQEVISNIFRRVLRHHFSNFVVNISRRVVLVSDICNALSIRRLLLTVRQGRRVSVLQFNLRLIFSSHLTCRHGRKGPFHIRRHDHTLHLLRISRTVRRFHRSFKFLKGTAHGVLRRTKVIHDITSHFNGRKGHANEDLRFIQGIHRGVTSRGLGAALLTRVQGRGHGGVVKSLTSPRVRVRHIKEARLAYLGTFTINIFHNHANNSVRQGQRFTFTRRTINQRRSRGVTSFNGHRHAILGGTRALHTQKGMYSQHR